MAAGRWLVIAVVAAGILVSLFSLSGAASVARMGIQTTRNTIDVQQYGAVLFVAATSPAEHAGLRIGDAVRYAGPADAAVADAHVPGTIVHLVRRDGSRVAVTLERILPPLRDVLLMIEGIAMGLLAIVLAARAWHERQARLLAVGFLWVTLLWARVETPDWLVTALPFATDVLLGVGNAALIMFAAGWDATPPRTARVLRVAAVVFGALYMVTNLYADFTSADVTAVSVVEFLALVAFMIGGLAVSTAHARGIERRRIGWILTTMTVAFAPWFVYEGLFALHLVREPPVWIAVSTFILPAGFGYAMLRNQIVDLGFALNRAAVFAATTALLVGLFGALQWGADRLLVQATGAQNFAVQMTIAVVVLYAVRAMRSKTDELVARLFFAARRQRIEAIRTLAREVDAVEHPDALAGFVIDQLRTGAAIDAALYVESDDAFVCAAGTLGPDRVARDAPTVIALRASLEAVPIRAESDLGGAIAFPLAVRGQLRGGLVCAVPSGDDDFAPDECDALAQLAVRVGIARDDLFAAGLRRENAALVREKQSLAERVAALERENVLLERMSGNGGPGRANATVAVSTE